MECSHCNDYALTHCTFGCVMFEIKEAEPECRYPR